MNNSDKNLQNHEYCSLLDSAREIILKFDMDGEIVFANQGALDITGYIDEEILGMNIADILPPEHLEELKTQLFGKSKNFPEIFLYEAQFINRELELIPIEINANAMFTDGTPSHILFIARDVSQRKIKEKEKVNIVKFEFLERFSKGIVKNLNKMLNEVINDIDFAHMASVPESTIYRRLSDAKNECENIKQFVQDIGSIASPGKLIKEIKPINKLLKQSIESSILDFHGVCDFAIYDDLWPIAFDDIQMDKVFCNLITNAAEAVTSGKVQVSAQNVLFKEEDSTSLMPSGEYVKISVQDNGEGIPQKHIDRIFDPYFSTKKTESDRIRGMGLTHVYSIIKKHRGYIQVNSKPGIRTKFTIYLPALRDEQQNNNINGHVNSYSESQKNSDPVLGKILVMDDEEIVRDVAGQMLHELNYQVAFARDGAEAVELYKASMVSGEPFNAVILDLNVKEGIGGKQAFKELRRIHPDVKGIASSGYSNDPEMKDFKSYGFSNVVGKPYSIWELEKILEKVLRD